MTERQSRGEVAREVVDSVREAIRTAPPGEVAIVYGLVPALLVGIHLAPGTGAWSLSLSASGVFESRWTLWTAYASSFVHGNDAHLANNVASYLLVLAVAYPLSVIAGWRRRLLAVVVVAVVVVPFVSAWVTLTALGPHTDVPSAGFSDVNSALLAYLLVVWFAALSRATGGTLDRGWAAVAFPATLAFVFAAPATVDYFPALYLPALGFAAVAVGAGSVLYRTSGPPRAPDLSAGTEFLAVVGASVFAAGFVGSMLYVPAGSNVYAHLAGYVVGGCVSLTAGVSRSD